MENGMDQKIGILLINIGTPDAPTEEAVSAFLAEFLSDPYVVDYPGWLWKPILNNIILRSRPKKSAHLYEKIWTSSGSPLLDISQSIQLKLDQKMPDWQTALGMRYGNPSIQTGLELLWSKGVNHLVILPLFPQYSSTTTLTAIRETEKQIKAGSGFKQITTIKDYHSHPAYISALADSIQEARLKNGEPDITLFSYHSIPKRLVVKQGEPYQAQCLLTSELTTKKLGLAAKKTAVSFQSRFGPEPWLSPYTDETLHDLGTAACPSIQVICPGFSVDCLETLEEISIQGKEIFTQAGGKEYHYIQALNDNDKHINALAEIIKDAISKDTRDERS